jgi:hypothetical protein
MRIYVAGSYSADNVIDVLSNIRRGIAYCARLIKEGHSPFCPWLDYQFSFFQDLSVEDYYRYSMAWLEVSEMVHVLPGSENSKGTQREIEFAEDELCLPIFYLREEDL